MKAKLKIRTAYLWAAAGAGLLFACWWPLQQLKAYPAQHALVDEQLMKVSNMAAQAAPLQAVNTASGATAPLTAALVQQAFGLTAQLTQQGDTATIQLQAVPAKEYVAGIDQLVQESRVTVKASRLKMAQGTVTGMVELLLPRGQ